ncbi:hypothetical protein CEXT_371411, partial [Caerostris extrusa]
SAVLRNMICGYLHQWSSVGERINIETSPVTSERLILIMHDDKQSDVRRPRHVP